MTGCMPCNRAQSQYTSYEPMSTIPEIKEIDSAMLTGPVRKALNSRAADIRQWQCHPIRYINTETSNLGLYRFKGTARDGNEDHAWSMILKAVDAPVNDTD